jgi:hypothetical protein
LEDGTVAVVRSDPRKPQFLEVIAIFSDVSRARSYAEMENSRFGEQPIAATEAPQRHIVEPTEVAAELSARQSAVLGALHAKMDENGQVAAKAAVLAEAASIPLGSLHSVLQSLEKKQLIKTARAGSARAPAVYQVL